MIIVTQTSGWRRFGHCSRPARVERCRDPRRCFGLFFLIVVGCSPKVSTDVAVDSGADRTAENLDASTVVDASVVDTSVVDASAVDASPDLRIDSFHEIPSETGSVGEGSIGTVGACAAPAPLPPGKCPIGLCGNARIDACGTLDGGATLAEECDTADLGSQTCTGLGFARGSLACAANCLFDTASCESCAMGPGTSFCARPDLGGASPTFSSYLLALAATDTEIGIAWLEAGQWLHFTRLGPNLAVLSDTPCLRPMVAGWAVALAVTPAGWLIAETNTPVASSIDFLSFDTTGALRVTHSMATQASEMQLVTRSDGGPLLLWVDGSWPTPGTLHARNLTEDGLAVGLEATLTGIDQRSVAGVFTDDGFELAAAQYQGSGNFPEHIQLAHVGLDGTLRMDAMTGPVPLAAHAGIIWSGSEVRLVHEGCESETSAFCSGGVFLRRFTQGGAELASPATIAFSREWVAGSPVAAIGTDTILLDRDAVDYLNQTLVRVDSSGSPVGAPEPVLRAANTNAMRMVRQGDDVVIAWFAAEADATQPKLELARIRLR